MTSSAFRSTGAAARSLDPVLPDEMRVLYIATTDRTGDWLAKALAADSASKVIVEEAVGSMAGLARLRDELFDAVLVSHQPGELDALELIEGYRTGGADSPIIVLGTESEQEMSVLCYELGADGYVCVNTATTRSLIWVVARAVQRHGLARENARLHQAEQRRLQQEHDEANRLLSQQRALIEDLELIESRNGAAQPAAWDRGGDGGRPTRANCPRPELPDELVAHYRELLRTYVIMGSGNLGCELGRLAELLTGAGVSACETMQLHLYVLEELVHGLGARSARHVMTRGDLLVMEIMIHLADGYRARYRERAEPPVQQCLPGFEELARRVA